MTTYKLLSANFLAAAKGAVASNMALETQIPKFFFISIFCTSLILSLALFVIIGTFPQVHAQVQEHTIIGFFANLSGSEEVPPNDSNATGIAVFLFNNDSSQLSYLVNTTGIEKISQSHIHNGSAGINGEAVAPLSDEKSTSGKNNSTILIEDEIKNDDLRGPLDGKQIEDLVAHMSNGSTYVNIHTDEFKDGAIRGQIVMGEVQLSGDAITGLMVPGGVIGLSGVSLQGGMIIFTHPGIVGFMPNSQTGDGSGNTVGNVVDGAGGVVGDVVDTVAGVVTQAGEQLGGTVDNTVGYVGEKAETVTSSVDDTSETIDNGIVQELVDNQDDGKDSDSGDSNDDDEKDSGDGDSVKDKVDGLLS